ncbi:hypothetical protein ACO0LO_20000 [Undibacterium sp. TJN25]|uniref:hypothetical protein n=1 Tax=Undibacterium sp. TJN25 TaxID=3413056 RepID=UPI003BF0465A
MSTFSLKFTKRTNDALLALSSDQAKIVDMTALANPSSTFTGMALLAPRRDGRPRLAITVEDGLSVSIFFMPLPDLNEASENTA